METSFEREVLDRLTKIEEKLNSYSDAKSKTYENEKKIITFDNELNEVKKKVSQLEENNKWLSRAIWGAVIVAAVGFLFSLIRTGAGM